MFKLRKMIKDTKDKLIEKQESLKTIDPFFNSKKEREDEIDKLKQQLNDLTSERLKRGILWITPISLIIALLSFLNPILKIIPPTKPVIIEQISPIENVENFKQEVEDLKEKMQSLKEDIEEEEKEFKELKKEITDLQKEKIKALNELLKLRIELSIKKK